MRSDAPPGAARHLDGYVLGECLRVTRRSIAYRATDTEDRPVILKFPATEQPTERELARERLALHLGTELGGEHVVEHLRLEPYGRALVLVTEDFGGIDLERYETSSLTLLERIQLGERIARALAHLHAHGVIHKDIKPSNIVWNPDSEELKLIDLGLASQLTAERPSRHISVEGTLAYMAPEQTGRMNRSVDTRSDLYSLGVLLYELLVGVTPFAATSPREVIHAHLARTPVPIRALSPEIPPAIEAIVARLLQKDPEARYQTAAGLAHDLSRCSAELAAGRQPDFEPAEHDLSSTFRVPEMLLGRDIERQSLFEALARSHRRSSETLLVTGPAGIGKSALVQEIAQPLAALGGTLCEGKFDATRRDLPYLGWRSALQSLVDQVTAESDELVDRLRARLREALGPTAAVLNELVPELEALLGVHPALPDVAPADAQARFRHAIRQFFRTLATPDRPVVLFLDDLQWADLASVHLLELLHSDPVLENLLVIGAYRSNEVGPSHALTMALGRLDHLGIGIPVHTLGPLDLSDTTRLVASALHQSTSSLGDLGRLVHDRTGGNPFFLRQFLQLLARDGAVSFDVSVPCWTWDLDAVTTAGVTESVAALMVRRLGEMPVPSQEVVAKASCIGTSFDLSSLADLLGLESQQVASALHPAITERLLIPLDDAYKLVIHAGQASILNPRYRFLHDRVHEAAYARLDESERVAAHLAIADTFLGRGESEDHLIDCVDHLASAGSFALLARNSETLVEQFLRASHRMKSLMALGSAARFATIGLELATALGAPDLERSLSVEAADIAYIDGRFEDVAPHAARALALARAPLERVPVYTLQIGMGVAQNEYVASTHLAVEVLASDLATYLPRSPGPLRVLAAVARTRWSLRGRDPMALLDLPPMRSETAHATMSLLMKTATNAYWGVPNLVPLIACEMVRQSLREGNCGLSAYGYALFGMVNGALGDVQTGFAYGKLGMALLDTTGDRHLLGKTGLLFHGFIRHAIDPLRQCAGDVLLHLDHAMEAGDIENAAYCGAVAYYADFLAGRPLEALDHRYREPIEAVLASGQEQTIYALRVWLQARALLGNIDTEGSALCGKIIDFPSVLAELLAEGKDMAIAQGVCASGWLAFILGDDTAACEAWSMLYEREEAATGQPYLKTCLGLYAVLLERKRGSAHLSRTERWRLRVLRARLGVWARHNAHDYAALDLFCRAEEASARGDLERASLRYADGVARAQESGNHYLTAAMMGRSSGVHAALGHHDMARQLLQRSRYLWSEYGSVRHRTTGSLGVSSSLTNTVTSSGELNLRTLDLDAMLDAVRVVSAQVDIHELAEKVAELSLQTAGATRAVLLLMGEERLHPFAEARVIGADIRLLSGEQVGEASLPKALVDLVLRSESPILIEDAQVHPLLADAPETRDGGIRSAAAVPLLRQGRLVGALVLEHSGHPHAFRREQTDTVQAIAGQAAVSLENAELFARQRRQAEVFAHFVPKPFLDHLNYDRVEDVRLGDGVEQRMSILFSDLRGYTKLCETMTPEQNFAFVNAYLARMTPAIERNQGFIDAFVGDAVMALFTGEADSAVRAAIAMQQSLTDYNGERGSVGRAALRMGIGIHTGTCRLGIIGSPTRMQANVSGDSVNVASRLEGLTKHYGSSLLISRDTRDAMRTAHHYTMRSAGLVQVKGRQGAIEVFDVLEARPPYEADLLRSITPVFDKAMTAFYDKDFSAACDGFSECLAKAPRDRLSGRYTELAAHYLVQGVPATWTGVDVREVK